MKQKSIIWRVLALLFFAFLWGENVHAEKKVWASNVWGTLYISYGEEPPTFWAFSWESIPVNLVDGHIPEWSQYFDEITEVSFHDSFADYHPTSCYKWFEGATKLVRIYGLKNFNTSDVESMQDMFSGCSSFGEDGITVSFETSKVKRMDGMFNGCSKLTHLKMSSNTSNVTNMSKMFQGCSSLTSVDISNFNTSNVKDMSGMFKGCSSLTSVDVSNFNTSNVRETAGMFEGCSSLTSLDVSNFSTPNLTNAWGMFKGCSGLTELDLLYFNERYLMNAAHMFDGCSNLTTIWASNKFNITVPITDCTDMFAGCTKLQGDIPFDESHVDGTYAKAEGGYFLNAFHPWVTLTDGTLTFHYGVKKTMGDGEHALNNGTVFPDWSRTPSSITKVVFEPSFAEARPTSCYEWFYEASNLANIEGIENLNTSEVTNMHLMFGGCKALESLDLSGFNMGKVTDMSNMFADCTKLTTLDLSRVNTSSVEKMGYMFSGCSGLTTLDLSAFNTSNATDMQYMFNGCSGLKDLVMDKNKFNTSKVANMECMFNGCSAMTAMDLSHFNTAEVVNIRRMFYGCSSLTNLDLTSFNTSKVQSFMGMFNGCWSLKTVDLSSFDTAKGQFFTAMFNGCSNLTTIWATDKFVVNAGSSNCQYMFKDCTSLVGSVEFNTKLIDYDNNRYACLYYGYFTDKQYTRPWATLEADGTLTFQYNYKPTLGDNEYALNPDPKDNADLLAIMPQVKKANLIYMRLYKPTSCASWFKGASQLTKIDALYSIDMSNVTDMSSMFEGCSALPSISFGSINTSSVKDMSGMFSGCSSLNSLDLSWFNTGEVTDMSRMFEGCSAFTLLDVSRLNTEKVTDMSAMFKNCTNLTTICASDQFVTDAVTSSADMFLGCTRLQGDIAYDEDNVDKTYATLNGGYFSNKATDIHPWAKYADGTLTFFYSNKTQLKQDEYYLNGTDDVPGWQANASAITKVVFDKSFTDYSPTSCYGWFSGAANLTDIEGWENLNTSKATTMREMFKGCSALETLDLLKLDTRAVTDMQGMFAGCTNLTTIYASSRFSTDKVTSSADMFLGCAKLKGDRACDGVHNIDKTYAKLDGGYFTNSPFAARVTLDADGTLTFRYGDRKLIGPDDYLLNVDRDDPGWLDKAASITKVVFDPSFADARPTSCNKWFAGAKSLTTIEGVEYLNTSEVTMMSEMFYECSSLTSIDVSHFNTSKVTSMYCMFYRCTSLTSLDLTNFNTSSVTDIYGLTRFDSSLEYMYLGENFTLEKVGKADDMVPTYKNTTVYISINNYHGVRPSCGYAKEAKPYVSINPNAPYGTFCVPVRGTLDGGFSGFDKLYRIKSVDTDNGVIIMEEAKSIEEGVSYVYRRNLPSDATRSIITFTPSNTQPNTPTLKNDNSLLKGTFERIYAPKGSYILLTDGNFHPVAAANSNPVGAYRAYLDLSQITGGSEVSMAQVFRMVFEDGEVTGIGGITDLADQQPKAIYDLSGRRVTTPQKGGIYIVNGKKIMYNK